jgi:hypothetical protein
MVEDLREGRGVGILHSHGIRIRIAEERMNQNIMRRWEKWHSKRHGKT